MKHNLIIVFIFLSVFNFCTQTLLGEKPKYLDTSLDFKTRARDLVQQMTLEEKISQLGSAAPAIPRLGISAYNWWNECLHGVARAGTATVFPQAIGLAATFDIKMMRKAADIISTEARAKHHEAQRNKDSKRPKGLSSWSPNIKRYKGLTFWSPNINIFRDPRWGRGQETYGEDPYLTGQMGIQFVKGLQGNDSKYLKVVATAKHFAVHNGPEPDRHSFNVTLNTRDLWETYLPAPLTLAGFSETQTRQTDTAGYPGSPAQLLGNRFFTFNTVVRVNQIETSRDITHGEDESSIHSPREARTFRETVEKGWPGARITWAFSWLALHDQRSNYKELRKLIVSYHKKYGDEITFIPGGYFANMYNARKQVNRDLHDGLQMVSDMVGGGYRPKSIIAGFLSAENLRFLAEEEGIHVCQGNIWSQYAIDNGDGDGSISYPYYPSREHFCKPAQGKEDFIDCVNLDGWTMDFLSAKYPGGRTINGEHCGSRQGVGPIETVIRLGTKRGTREMLATTAAHFDRGFELNNFAWVTCIWELCLVEGRKIYGYKGRNGLDGLVIWLSEMRKRWPGAKCITQGEFGLLWRKQFKNNDNLNYRFIQRGSGICGSDPDKEIRWFMNKDFRLALLRDWKANTPEKLIDFTRYDLKAREPADPKAGQHTRNWSLMNRLNQKGVRPQDKPISIEQLNAVEQAIIKGRYPELINEVKQQINYEPFIWPSTPPDDCPFEKSTDIVGIRFTGKCNDLHMDGAPFADTWYFSWASDDKIYSPFTDGAVPRLDGGRDHSISWKYPYSTGQAIAEGDDPINLKIYSLGLTHSPPEPYGGRYPCGSLVYNGVWYYGTYCLSPEGFTFFGGERYNWPWLGPFVGFRISTDFGRTWKNCPHTPEKPLFNETGMYGYPVKIGAPHFVDFGKNMEHSPDGYAYLVGHGAEYPDKEHRFANLSWISGDQIYLIRVKPSVENINDASMYEFFSGYDKTSNPVWTNKFESIKPLIDWNNNCGCVTMTYNAPLKKYLMCITDGWPTVRKMNSYILESDNITGPWKLAVYMKDFGQQGYFLNFPTKFISENGRKAWLCYSGNFWDIYKGEEIKADPPGSHYGLVLQEIELLSKEMYERHSDDLRKNLE